MKRLLEPLLRYNDRVKLLVALLLASLAAQAADVVATPYESAREILASLAPPELQSANSQAFSAWTRDKDASIRARLAQGELDSLVNLLLFGTSFTNQPRMSIENLAEESRRGLLRSRLDDLLKGLASPGLNERLVILRNLLQAKGYQPGDPQTGSFILENLQRVLKEKIAVNAEIQVAQSSSSVFRERGVSLDTTIFPNYVIDAAINDLGNRKLLTTGSVTRAAIVGPGLDFIDKEAGFDYYPLQTLQPFAVQSSLRRQGLASAALRITILDISPQVLEHIKLARSRETRYIIQLPRNSATQWTSAVLDYWRNFGAGTATPVDPLPPHPNLASVETRAVRFPVSSILAIDAVDLNIVTQGLDLPETEKFDLIVATNILVYYNPFEQALALANIAAMLKPGGILLSNDPLPSIPAIPMRVQGQTNVTYSELATDTVHWYQRQ